MNVNQWAESVGLTRGMAHIIGGCMADGLRLAAEGWNFRSRERELVRQIEDTYAAHRELVSRVSPNDPRERVSSEQEAEMRGQMSRLSLRARALRCALAMEIAMG